MLRNALCVTLGTLLAANVATAQETYTADGFGPETGSWELILGASGSNDKDFENGGFNLNAEVGYYMTPALEVGLRQNVGFADSDGSSASILSTAGFVDYHFDFGALRPFIGVSIGGQYGNAIQDAFIAGPEAGLKWYVKDETFIYGRASYDFAFRSADDADDAFDDGRFNYVIGIGFNF